MRAKKLFTLIILLFTAAFAHAATHLVPAQYPNIQAAIDDCNDGDTVIVAPGTYTGPGNRDISYKGKPITVRSTDPNDPEAVASTIVDCQGAGRGFYFANGEKGTSVLAGLTITKGFSDLGGGVFCGYSSPTITHCTIAQCTALGGGGVFVDHSGPAVIHCALTGNKATDSGGGFCLMYGTAQITHCAVEDNYANRGGGGFYLHGGANVIKNCLVMGNSASSFSGGIQSEYSKPSITNCVIAHNSAGGADPSTGSCGGLYFLGGTPVITNSSIIYNSANITGGGIVCSGSTLTLANSVIWANTAPDAPNILDGSVIRYSDVQGGFPGAGNIDADPLFADPGSGDYHLSASSPCIDAGNPAYHPAPGETDIDGQPRLFGGRVDMGADEYLMPGRSAIVVFPHTVGFALFEGHDNPPQTTIQIWNVGVGSLNWQITEDCPWLQVNPQAGTSRGDANEVTLTADVSALPWGHFDCNLTISDPNAANSPLALPVGLEVIGPILSVGSNRFDFQCGKENPTPPDQTLIIQNGGGGALNWQITTPNDCNWLSVYPLTGRSTGQINEVTLSVDATGLDYGSYSCQLLISDSNAQHGLEAIQVNLTLPAPVIAVGATKFQFHAWIDNPTPPEQILSIKNAGGDMVNWQISMPANCPWLTVYPLAGRSSGDVNDIALRVDATGLADDFYSCTLTISDPNAANSPQSVKVELLLGIQEGWVYVPSEHPNIQAAIDWALPGDIVVVAPGTYTGPGNRDIDFRGKPITVRSTDPNDTDIVAQTIIDCNSVPYYRVFHFHSGEDANSILSGFTITKGHYGSSGAIVCVNSSPTMSNCTITANACAGGRGCSGGGIYCYKSSPIISNCTISGNWSDQGGGIYCSQSNLVVTDCLFTGNSSWLGAGIFCDSSNVVVINCLFTGNSSARGGGIYCWESNAVIDNCIFSGNSVEYYGGAIYSYRGNLTLANATVTENSAKSRGGALYCDYSGKPTITNSILYFNAAPQGPEIALEPYYRDPSLLNLAVSYSNVRGGPSAVWNERGVGVDWGPGNIDVEPYFVDANNGDYHLKSRGWRWDAQRKTWTWDAVTSRCIDAGEPDALLRDEPLFVPVDPTGYWGANLRIDMGAYGGTAEASIPPHGWAVRTDYSNDGIANFTDFAYWTKSHPYTAGEPLGPLNPSPALGPIDLAVLAADWLDQTTWFGTVPPPTAAWNPNPPDGSVGIRLDPVLSWEPGFGATSHDVYFGTSDPPTFQASTTATTFAPGYLSKNTTYYWRIDEVNPFGRTAGPVWCFTTGTGGGGGR